MFLKQKQINNKYQIAPKIAAQACWVRYHPNQSLDRNCTWMCSNSVLILTKSINIIIKPALVFNQSITIKISIETIDATMMCRGSTGLQFFLTQKVNCMILNGTSGCGPRKAP